ncbi:MAG: 1,4-alpha-glucan branching protein, partial [Ktedonobacterales bacterium]|nr:1,4-alpha-glucan branching protein [Ktedonobacterales bacterium]
MTAQTSRSGSTKPARYPGMGAIPYHGGTTFRLWAPNASSVFVIGDFNAWAAEATPLTAEANGFWAADVASVTHGAAYRYRIVTGETSFERRDPYSRALNADSSASVVTQHVPPRETPSYQTPAWNEMVIYEMHIGTFNPPAGKLPGTFDDAIARFPYLRDLGVNVIEVLPIMEYPGDISWGYNPA